MKMILASLAVVLAAAPAFADEPDGLKLPPGFHADVVADKLGAIRHIAFRDNNEMYISTLRAPTGFGGGIVAVHLDAAHKADKTQSFGTVDGGTGIRIYHGMLYASTTSRVYRYKFHGKDLLPDPEPEIVVDGMPASRNVVRGLAFDGKGNLYVSMGATGAANFCTNSPANAVPVGLKPCPILAERAGIWRFSATKLNQQFPKDGEQLATGIRDMAAVDWSPSDGALYAIMHGRDSMNKTFPKIVSAADDDNIGDEMHKVTKGTDFGWPFTYYDGARNIRLVSPEYGGDGKTAAPTGVYSTPVQVFASGRASPLDLTFYTGKSFPAEYRGGAFITRHGTGRHSGFDVVFIPFDKSGKAGEMKEFAEGFAGPSPANRDPAKAKYRPVGVAQAPNGDLYVSDSQAGRVWRIYYSAP
jgi:glucose/arabinose dehydrogenase